MGLFLWAVAVLWLAGLPVGRWPAWCACRCPSATRSTHGPPVGVRGAGGPTPWAGGLPGVRVGAGGRCRGQGAYLVAVLVLAGLPVGPCACRCPSATRSTHGPPVAVPVLAGLPLSR